MQSTLETTARRAELTPAQQADHLKRRKEVWERLQSAQIVPIESSRDDGRGHRKREFASETAEATGRSKQDINRAVSRGEKIAPVALRGSHRTPLTHAGQAWLAA